MAEALILKTSPRIKDKAKAQELLEQVVEEETIIHEATSCAISNLCELLLDEFKAFGEPSVFQEAKELVKNLHNLAKKECTLTLVVDTLILQAKFAMVEGDLTEAIRFLDQAKATAKEKGLGLKVEKASKERENLEEQFETWESLIQSNAPLQSRLERVRAEEYLKEARKLVSLDSSELGEE